MYEKDGKFSIKLVGVLFTFIFVLGVGSFAIADEEPLIWTDSENYPIEETVLISGEGFEADSSLTAMITKPNDDVVILNDLNSNEEGNFENYDYDLDGSEGIYEVEICDENDNCGDQSFTVFVASLWVTYPDGGEVVSGTVDVEFFANVAGSQQGLVDVWYSKDGCNPPWNWIDDEPVNGDGLYSVSWDTTQDIDDVDYCIGIEDQGWVDGFDWDYSNGVFEVDNVGDNVCGNDIVEPPEEECDGGVGDLNCNDYLGQGWYGDLSCYSQGYNDECMFDISGCEEDNDTLDVEVNSPSADIPPVWYYGDILIQGTVTETWPGSGINYVETQIGDQFGSWFTPFYLMTYDGINYYEYLWDSINDSNAASCGSANVKIRAYDNAGNMGSDTNLFAFDNEDPVTTKDLTGLMVDCGDQDCDYYVTQDIEICLSATDGNPDCSGVDATYYKLWWKEDWEDEFEVRQDWTEYTECFSFDEDSIHKVEYYSVDVAGNDEDIIEEIDVVDTQAPESYKELGTPKVECSPAEKSQYGINDCWYVTDNTQVELFCEDLQPHPVDDVTLHYKVEWKENWGDSWTTLEESTAGDYYSFYYEQDSFHKLTWYCEDSLDNIETEHVELDIVDTQAPELIKVVGDPSVLVDPGCNPSLEICDYYVTINTPIDLTCTDPGPHPSDVKLYYRFYLDGTTPPDYNLDDDGDVTIYSPQDSTHILEAYCEDSLGNWECMENIYEIDYVDTQPPVTTKTLGTPKVECSPAEKAIYGDDCWYITQSTFVGLSCVDQDPHPVDDVTLHYKVEWKENWGDSWTTLEESTTDGNYEPNYDEDSFHKLTWHC
ncbi:hypothetical protein K8R47_03375, partial [archaeon]|nr:hypothetical protein [archaeon]